ncbi:MAG: beta-N-acetylhexosaminidase [Polyangiales bacterium]
MPPHDLVHLCGQLLVVGFDGTSLPAAPHDLASLLRSGQRGGVIVFKRNVRATAEGALDVDALCALNAAIIDACPRDLPPLVSVDQEGGRVKRLSAPALQAPPMRLVGSLSSEEIRSIAAQAGRELRALGFSMSFAPVLDVDTNPANPVIGDRSFGATPDVVAMAGIATARGLADAGVLSCGKHFPGHGDTELDSHLALPRVKHDRARIEAVELAPFRDAIAAGILDSIMTAHVVFDAIERDVPATFSRKAMIDVLRTELGFAGICISDDLFMRGVSPAGGDDPREIAVAAVRAIEAGCDVLLVAREGPSAKAAQAALVERASRDEVFAARVREAFDRSIAMRRRAVACVDHGAFARSIASDERATVDAILTRAASPRRTP